MKNINAFAKIRLLCLISSVVLLSLFQYSCNDSSDKPADTETPATTPDSVTATDTTNRLNDTLATDTTKGGQPVPPR